MIVSKLTPTERILAMDSHLKVSETERGFNIFTAYDYPGRDPAVGEVSVGIGVEDGEFMYALIRGIKPKRVLETGSNVGISSRFIALAMSDNGGGVFDTIEHDGTLAPIARGKMSWIPGVNITAHRIASKDFTPSGMYEFMFFDSNPPDRMPDMLRYLEHLTPGGMAWTHDHQNVENKGVTDIHGSVPEELKDKMRAGTLRGIVLNAHHGGCLFQKPFEFDWMRDAITKVG